MPRTQDFDPRIVDLVKAVIVNAIRDADTLKEAMIGRSDWMGTDNKTLTNILANRSPAQLRQIASEYKSQTGDDFRTQVENETSAFR